MTASAHPDDHPIAVVGSTGEGQIITFDSATFVPGHYDSRSATNDVIVAASYSGILCARMVARCRPRGVIGLDCAVGKDAAGIAGLWFYEALGIPAAAADVNTAEMGNGADLFAAGIVAHVNELARSLGLRRGMTVVDAAGILGQARGASEAETLLSDQENREVVYTNAAGRSIVCTDSIAFARSEDRNRNVLCTAGHTGRSVVHYIVDSAPWGFICSDGGIGKNRSGLSALGPADVAGIPGASVSALTARMGDGHSTYFDGEISAANGLALAKGVTVGQAATEAARLLCDH